MKLNYPLIAEIGYHTYAVDEYGMAAFYVLWGTERGLVIDLGCGSFDARKLVEELCPLPYDIVLTHGHGDHVGAMSQWDKVWLHPGDYERISDLHRMKEMLWENPAVHNSAAQRDGCLPSPAGKAWDYPYMHNVATDMYDINEDMFMGFDKVPKFLPLADGQIFDLGGGRICEIVHTPGHTAGSCSVIDHQARILFSGDACNPFYGMSGGSVNGALRGLLKLKERQHLFDRNYNGHTGANADPFCLSIPAQVLDECIYICRGVLHGTIEVEELPPRPFPGPKKPGQPLPKPIRIKYGITSIMCDANRLIDEDEEPVE